VLDTRELGRRPGSLRKVSLTVPAPADLGIDVLGVAQGSDIDLTLRLESVMDGVLVTGTARAAVGGECVRCLDPLERELEAELQELFAYPEVEQAGDDDELFRLDGVLLDLEPVLRDAVVLALPLKPLCRDDCPGLCAECGARLADDPEHGHEVVDARWAALQELSPQTPDPAASPTPPSLTPTHSPSTETQES